MDGWRRYFKVVGIVPGKVLTRLLGPVDFSDPSLPVEKVQQLYEADSPWLQLTPEGEQELYGIPKPAAAVRPEPVAASGPGHGAAILKEETPEDPPDMATPDDDRVEQPDRRRGKKKRATFFDPIEPGPEDLQ